MTRASKIIIGLAVFTAAIPLLGFPGVVKDGLTVIFGLSIAAITYWAEKHARFCPECKLPENTPHDHEKKEVSFSEENKARDITPTFGNVSVGSDIVPKTMSDVRMKSETMRTNLNSSSPSPFSFDAEQKPQKSRRSERRKTSIAA